MLDIPELKVKTGISHRYLRPAQAIVDPSRAALPAEVTSSTGLDVICHAAESYLARPTTSAQRPATPDDRPPYQGANPVADVWSAKALEYGGRFLRRAVADADDVEARGAMMLAATMAGVGFGSAGVHIPHACAYPIAGLEHEYRPPGYPDDHPFVPHGHSVIVTAPAAFRFTYEAAPERHHRVAELLAGEPPTEPGPDTLPDACARSCATSGPARRRRARLRRGRRARARGGRAQAAAPARVGPREVGRPGPGPSSRVDAQLVSARLCVARREEAAEDVQRAVEVAAQQAHRPRRVVTGEGVDHPRVLGVGVVEDLGRMGDVRDQL